MPKNYWISGKQCKPKSYATIAAYDLGSHSLMMPVCPKLTVDTERLYFLLQKQNKNIETNDVDKQPVKAHVIEPKIEDEWETLPAWKKEIMMKRGGAPSNWGDEREEVNEED